MRRPSIPDRGAVLLLILVLLVVCTLGLIALLGPGISLKGLSGLFRRGVSLELMAKSGFNIVQVQLLDRTRELNGFTSDVQWPDGTTVNAVDAGIKYPGPSDPERTVREYLRKNEQENVLLQIYLFPQDPGPAKGGGLFDWDSFYPKYFLLISQATKTNSGEVHTIEALIQLREENLSEISFGMLNPTPLLGQSIPVFAPATYDGRTHFGNPPGNQQIWFSGWGCCWHWFKGAVTFANEPKSGKKYPFDYDTTRGANINFEKGYVDGYPIEQDSETIFTELPTKVESGKYINLSGSDLCFKFVVNSTTQKGEIWQYTCDTSQYSPMHRYVGEVEDRDNNNSSNVIQKFTNLDGKIFANPDGNIHVKGIVEGAVTVAARNVFLEGDVVYDDQSKESTDRFGAIARHNLVVPLGSPYGVLEPAPDGINSEISPWGWRVDVKSPVSNPHTGITNFIPPTEDRDLGNEEYNLGWYDKASQGGVAGHANGVSTLDLDGSFLALGEKQTDGTYIGGILEVEGLYDLVTNPKTGMTIPGKTTDGGYKLYAWATDIDGTKPNAYWYVDPNDGTLKRRADPVFCASWKTDGTCPTPEERKAAGLPAAETGRPDAHAIWAFGGMITNGYSYTLRTATVVNNGFGRRIYHEDPRMRIAPPPGIPNTGQIGQDILWMKNYRGRSEVLKTYLGG